MRHPVGTFELWGGIVEWINGEQPLEAILEDVEANWNCLEQNDSPSVSEPWNWENNECCAALGMNYVRGEGCQ